jgi:hypothetical protein
MRSFIFRRPFDCLEQVEEAIPKIAAEIDASRLSLLQTLRCFQLDITENLEYLRCHLRNFCLDPKRNKFDSTQIIKPIVEVN